MRYKCHIIAPQSLIGLIALHVTALLGHQRTVNRFEFDGPIDVWVISLIS